MIERQEVLADFPHRTEEPGQDVHDIADLRDAASLRVYARYSDRGMKW